MGKVTHVVPQLTTEEIMEGMKQTAGFWRVQKWLVILNATVDPRPAKLIALHLGLSEQTVHNLVSSYNRYGPIVMGGPGKGGRRRAYSSLADESAFLEPFSKKALIGQIATVAEIKLAWEKALGRKVHKTTVYRMLERQEWHKVVLHEKSKAQGQETF